MVVGHDGVGGAQALDAGLEVGQVLESIEVVDGCGQRPFSACRPQRRRATRGEMGCWP